MRPVISRSAERSASEGVFLTANELTTDTTLSTLAISCSTACLSFSLGTSPVSRTCRL